MANSDADGPADSPAYGWEGAPGTGHELGPGFLARSQLVERWLSKLRPAYALEVGCGRGNLTARVARHCKRFVAFDISPEAGRIARAKSSQIAGVDVLLAAIDSLPFRERFDAVILAEVLEHLDDDAGALERAIGLLADDGHAIVTVPAHQSMWTEQDDAAGHKRRYARDEIRSLLERGGLEILELVCWGFPITRQLVLRGGSAAAGYRREGRAKLPQAMRLARDLYAPLARPVARLEYLLSGLDRGVGYALLARRGAS